MHAGQDKTQVQYDLRVTGIEMKNAGCLGGSVG